MLQLFWSNWCGDREPRHTESEVILRHVQHGAGGTVIIVYVGGLFRWWSGRGVVGHGSGFGEWRGSRTV